MRHLLLVALVAAFGAVPTTPEYIMLHGHAATTRVDLLASSSASASSASSASSTTVASISASNASNSSASAPVSTSASSSAVNGTNGTNDTNAAPRKPCQYGVPGCEGDLLIANAKAANERLLARIQRVEAAEARLKAKDAARIKALALAHSLDPDKFTLGGGNGTAGGMPSSFLGAGRYDEVVPPTACGHYSCGTLLVKYLRGDFNQRSCVPSMDTIQQFKRADCSAFELADGSCDKQKVR